MNADAIREWLSQVPFTPFAIELSNGKSFDVRHPENAILLKSRLMVGYPETDRAVHVALIHINTIEALDSSEQSRSNNGS